MDLHGFFTENGQALAAKLAAGITPLTVTRVVAGSGQTLSAANALTQPVQVLSVNSPTRAGSTATISATLIAAEAADSYALTELGVYAEDPDMGEILYKIYRIETPVTVSAGSRTVLRFYLEETVADDAEVSVVCSPAGLVTEAQLRPALDKLNANQPESISVSLAAADLQTYLNQLPRYLNAIYTITVSGAVESPINISFFSGSGRLTIKAENLGNCTLSKVSVVDCAVPVFFQKIRFQETPNFGNYARMLEAQGSYVMASSCSFTGLGSGTTACAFGATQDGSLWASACSVSGCNVVAYAGNMGMILVNGSSDFQSNTAGAMVYNGGAVMIGTDSISNTLNAGANDKRGGCVIAYDGSLV